MRIGLTPGMRLVGLLRRRSSGALKMRLASVESEKGMEGAVGVL